MFYSFARFISRLIQPMLFKVRVYGMENVPEEGGFIFAANHESYIDPFIMGTISPRKIHFVARESLFRNPVFGWIISHCGAFPVRRDSADMRSIKSALSFLKAGRGMLIFPEGTRFRQDGQRPIQAGVALLASKAQVPVLPVYIANSAQVLPPGAKWFRHETVDIYIGKPMIVGTKTLYPQAAEKVMEAVYSLPKYIGE